jgi:hypothetical protein
VKLLVVKMVCVIPTTSSPTRAKNKKKQKRKGVRVRDWDWVRQYSMAEERRDVKFFKN